MTAIVLLMTLVLSLLAVPLAAEAQRVAKIPRVGFLRHGRQADAPLQRHLDDFRQTYQRQGFTINGTAGQRRAPRLRWSIEWPSAEVLGRASPCLAS